MRRVVKGHLADKPEIKTRESKDGRKFNVAEFTVFESDPTSAKKGESWPSIPRKCIAYGDVCKDLMDFNKGDVITAAATIKVSEYQGKDSAGNLLTNDNGEPVIRRTERFQFDRIDKENTLDKQLNQLLSAYSKGDIDKIDSGLDATFPSIDKAAEIELEGEKTVEIEQESEAISNFEESSFENVDIDDYDING